MDNALPIRVAILTLSDSASQKERVDTSGPALAQHVETLKYTVVHREILPDDPQILRTTLVTLVDTLRPDLILTTGGTGLGPRDHTPEATAAIMDREVPGLAELMRMRGARHTPRAMLSRARAVIRSKTLIINLPGSRRGAIESLQAIEDLLPHAVELVRGNSVRCGD